MRLSKSRFMELHQCEKAGWLSVRRPDLYENDTKSNELLKTGTEIGDLARSFFGKYTMVEIEKDKANMIRETEKLIKNGESLIAEASFSYNGCFCSVDMLKVINKEEKKISVYEVKSTTMVKPEHLIDMAFQYYVITGLGYEIVNFGHIHINSEYEREGELDISKLFIQHNCIPDILLNLSVIEDNIDNYKNLLDNLSEPKICIGCQCHSPMDCKYFEYCTSDLPTPNIFDLKGKGITFKKKVELYGKGIVSFADILSKKPNINEARLKEVECAVTGKDLPINIKEIKNFLNKFKYPIYFFDFESFQRPIPEFDYQKPFIQIPFQYSLHILNEDGSLIHKEYIAPVGSDSRILVRDMMIKDIPDDGGSIIAYNDTFEKMIIKDMAEISPLHYSTLMKYKNRFIDLMDPFAKQWIYKKAFKGSYSIKYVLPALFPDDPELDYSKLDMIQNGSGAMAAYQNMYKFTKEEQDKMFERLYKYCKLDTYAMVKIYWYLLSLIKLV